MALLARALSREASPDVDPSVTPDSDPELVAGIRAGSADAFDAAYARYAPRLLRFLLRLCDGRASAEDVLQDAWLKLATRAGELAPDTDLGAWLFTVARNGWRSRVRGERRVAPLERDEEPEALQPTPETRASAASSVQALERALRTLAPADREILLLVGVEELSHAAAGAVLGVNDVVFRQRLHRARSRLKTVLERAAPRAAADWKDE
jgi:RNA polymerase sigma-70 factor (ECF subfamily)